MYRMFDSRGPAGPVLAMLAPERREFERRLVADRPVAVVSAYPMYGYMLDQIARRGGPKDFLRVTVVTDSISINSVWHRCGSDYYCVPNEETAEVMRRAGVPAEKLRVLGFPVEMRFADAKALPGTPRTRRPRRSPRALHDQRRAPCRAGNGATVARAGRGADDHGRARRDDESHRRTTRRRTRPPAEAGTGHRLDARGAGATSQPPFAHQQGRRRDDPGDDCGPVPDDYQPGRAGSRKRATRSCSRKTTPAVSDLVLNRSRGRWRRRSQTVRGCTGSGPRTLPNSAGRTPRGRMRGLF